MAGADRRQPFAGGDIPVRAASALVLAAVALAGAWFGGWAAAIVIVAAAVIVSVEWIGLTGDRRREAYAFTAALAVAALVAAAGYPLAGIAGALVVVVAGYAFGLNTWRAAGLLYAGVLAFGFILIRLSPVAGLPALMLVLFTVWFCDTGAFFAGRLIGGPKLWPAVSPKKTWAGAIGGVVAGTIAGTAVAAIAGYPAGLPVVLVSATLAVSAVAGDLLESWVKRRFDAKDSGVLVPGHGGFMDRVDGLLAAGGVAALIGAIHGGPAAIALGLIAW